jgi:hypothetical protein
MLVSLYIPPPLPTALLSAKVQFVTVGEPVELDIPPPLSALLPEKVQLLVIGEED